MTLSIVVVPPVARGALADPSLRRRLSRGRLEFSRPSQEVISRTLALVGAPVPDDGLAALRYLGEADRRPDGWITAADPVHFETRLRHLAVRRLPSADLSGEDVSAIFATLQAELGGEYGLRFECVGTRGYIRAAEPFATAAVSADVADGESPDAFALVHGDAGRYHRLLGELQLILHEHAVNGRRAETGRRPVNSLWLWGGGVLPAAMPSTLPRLIGDDALFRGYWRRNGGEEAPAIETVADTMSGSAPFVYVAGDAPLAVDLALRASRRRGVAVVSRDGLTVGLGPLDRFMIWRGISPHLANAAADD